MANIDPVFEQQLAEMSSEDAAALWARTRPPAEQPRRGQGGIAEAERRFGKRGN